jgi:hypothetical protein
MEDTMGWEESQREVMRSRDVNIALLDILVTNRMNLQVMLSEVGILL